MKLLEIVTGRCLRLFRVIHPHGGLLIPELAHATQARYQFVRGPENLGEVVSTKTAIFEHGTFNRRLVKRIAFGDGFFACDVQGKTDDAEALANDIEAWAIELGYQRKDDGVTATAYASEVEFSLSIAASARLKELAAFGGKVGEFVRSYGNESGDYALDRIGFIADPTAFQLLRTVPFAIERRAGLPFSKDLWYSAAPLRTDDHLTLLGEYAALLE